MFLCTGNLALAQTEDNAAARQKQEQKEAQELQHLYERHKADIDEKTLDKVDDLKTLMGAVICLRPEVKKLGLGGITAEDKLLVVKTKKDELTVILNGEKLTIPHNELHQFMEYETRELLIVTFVEAEKIQELKDGTARKQAEEKSTRQKEEDEKAQRQENLKKYRQLIDEFNEQEAGPINTKMERAYKGEAPYWMWLDKHGSGKLETYRDEKFVLSPRNFVKAIERIKARLECFKNENEAKRFELLQTMQADTFGLFSWDTFINLRTGDTFSTQGTREMNMQWWESANYLAQHKDDAPFVYDGTISMQYVIDNAKEDEFDNIAEAMVGERVFLLDSMKYDVITAIEQTPKHLEYTVLCLQKRGGMEQWHQSCISVKWFEQLQRMVGKKVLDGSDFAYFENDRLWKEDIPNMKTYTVDAIEVKDHELCVTLSSEGKTEIVKGTGINGKCTFLACPIDFAAEKELRKAGDKHLEIHNEYVSYDAALATMPAKTAAAKQKEAQEKAEHNASLKRMEALKNHTMIGKSIDDFLKTYRGAKLVNTTSEGGITIKVYQYAGYQLVFQNGKCVSIHTH